MHVGSLRHWRTSGIAGPDSAAKAVRCIKPRLTTWFYVPWYPGAYAEPSDHTINTCRHDQRTFRRRVPTIRETPECFRRDDGYTTKNNILVPAASADAWASGPTSAPGRPSSSSSEEAGLTPQAPSVQRTERAHCPPRLFMRLMGKPLPAVSHAPQHKRREMDMQSHCCSIALFSKLKIPVLERALKSLQPLAGRPSL